MKIKIGKNYSLPTNIFFVLNKNKKMFLYFNNGKINLSELKIAKKLLEKFLKKYSKQDIDLYNYELEKNIDDLFNEKDNTKKYTKRKIPLKLRLQVYKRDNYKCVDCESEDNLTCDHVIPESKGGETTLNNLATRCDKCNKKKGTKIYENINKNAV